MYLFFQVKEAAEISMGTEISDLDLINIRALCDQIVEIQDYRLEKLSTHVVSNTCSKTNKITTRDFKHVF